MALRSIYFDIFNDDGTPSTGRTPTFLYFKNFKTRADVTPQPVIVELGNGTYYFQYDSTAGVPVIAKVDAGSTITDGTKRYLTVAVDSTDDKIEKLSSYVAGKFDFNPTTNVARFYADDGTTVLFTATLTKDGSGNVTARAIS